MTPISEEQPISPVPVGATTADTDELIRARAYGFWESRMRLGIEGTPEGDWLMAEETLDKSITDQVKAELKR